MMSWNLVLALARRPDLWVEGLRTLFAIAPKSWWRTPPFLPRPDVPYAAWRVQTAQGRADAPVAPAELIAYLEWRRRQHRLLRRV
jgi:hypothetical protein